MNEEHNQRPDEYRRTSEREKMKENKHSDKIKKIIHVQHVSY